jgi:hypothetical protein
MGQKDTSINNKGGLRNVSGLCFALASSSPLSTIISINTINKKYNKNKSTLLEFKV